MPPNLLVRNLDRADLERLAAFCARYRQAYPAANLLPPELYANHPDLEGGRNVFCVLDGEVLVGFAPLFPVPLEDDCPPEEPHHIWTIVVADPSREDASEIRDLLLGRVLERAAALKATMAPRRPVRLAAELMSGQKADVEHLLARGFAHYESMPRMRRDLADPIPDLPTPAGVTVRRWRMPSTEEQQSYVQAFNTCFPELPRTLEAVQFFLQSPQWAGGTAVAAFDPHGALAGSILAYPGPDQSYGVADEVFVLPAWRRRGIARYLLAEGLRYLRAQGLPEVWLETLASNTPAVSLYRSLGYTPVLEKLLLGRFV